MAGEYRNLAIHLADSKEIEVAALFLSEIGCSNPKK
jgi:hypothetical protein